MTVKQYKPTSPARRQASVVSYRDLDRVAPCSSLIAPLRGTGGRNNRGRITVRHRGGGHRRHYRIIDFKRDKRDIPGRVEYIEYDPNRTAFIARILYRDGERRYILAPDKLQKGQTIIAAEKVDVKPGNAMSLANVPFGTFVHNIEMQAGKGGQMARSAGTYAQLAGRVDGFALLKLPSGEMRKVRQDCFATIGVVGNSDHLNISLGKAGRKRWLGIRPTVRGVAMNPVDHPHGGGEGRSSGGRHPVTPWAVPTKGHKTRHNKRTDKLIVKRKG